MSREQQSSAADDMSYWFTIIGIVFVLAIALLPAVPFAVVFILLWRAFRLNWRYLVLAALAAVLLLVVTNTGGFVLSGYLEALKGAFLATKEGRFSLAGLAWGKLLPGAALAGLFGATAIAAFAEAQEVKFEKRKPAVNKDDNSGFLSSWWERRLLRKISRSKHPETGVLLGVSKETGRPVLLTDRELNQHTLLVGTTGSGKTTTMMNFVESALCRGIPLVLVDGKGARDLAERVKFLADQYDRSFYLFSMHGESWHYNPLARGGTTELKDKLISLTEWSEEHYKKIAERYLQLVFRCLSLAGEKPDLSRLAGYLDPDELALVARGIADEEERNRILNALDAFGTEIRGLAARIAVMAESEIGHLFHDEPGRTIDLARAIEENAVVVFLLDSLSFPEYSRLLGRLIVTDLKGVAARQGGKKRIYTIFDEFNVFASHAVVDLIAKTRSFGFHALICTQSPSDLERAGGQALVEQIVENCNTYVIQRQNSAINAEKLASVIGTTDSYEVTYQVQEKGLFASGRTGLGSLRQTREFIVHPDEIKRLGTGEAILVRKACGFKVEKVRIRNPGVEA